VGERVEEGKDGGEKGGRRKRWGGKGDGRVGKEVGEGLAIVQF